MSRRPQRHTFLAAAAALALGSPLAFAGGTVEGTLAPGEYAFTLGVQDTPTGFGDNLSELNAAYADVLSDGSIRLMLTGNLETNGNGIVFFMDSRAGGGIATSLPGGYGQFGSVGGARTDDWGTDIDGEITVNPPPGGPSVMSPGFNPELSFEINSGGGTGDYYINLIDLTVENSPLPNRDVFLGQNLYGNPAVTQTYLREPTSTPAGSVTHAFDNTNAAGVNGFDFGNPPGPLGDPLSATKGFEAQLDALFVNQDPLTEIKIFPFITNGGGDYLSNQFLPGVGGVTNLMQAGQGPGGTPLFDTREFANPTTRYLTVPLPTINAPNVWGVDAAWNTGHAPNGVNASAVIAGSGGGIEITSPITLGGLGFRTANGYILAGPAGITLDTLPRWDGSARSARLEATAGSHTISAAMTWNQNVVASVAASSSLTVNSDVTVAAGKGLTKIGPGTFGMKNLRMASVDIQEGTLRVLPGASNGEPARVSKVTTFTIAGGPSAPAAKLDLTNNALILTSTGGADPAADVKAYVTSAYAAGAWTGNGIGSSNANANNFAVGYGTAAQIGAGASYLGQPVNADDVIARTTRYGDADLSGTVNLQDFNRLAANFGSATAVWSQGDFDYNGSVNLQDFNRLAANFGLSAAGPSVTPDDWARLGAAVPEPASLALVALGAVALVRRRRGAR
jgi:hypothetical protein